MVKTLNKDYGYWSDRDYWSFMLIGWIVSSRLKGKFQRYSQVHLTKDLTGADVAKRSCIVICSGKVYVSSER